MSELITQIKQSEPEDISEILDAALTRYKELFPEWEVTLISLSKIESETEQIDRMIQLLHNMKTSP